MLSEREQREYRKFEQELFSVLLSFENAREWADLSNCLIKLYKVFNLDVTAESHAVERREVERERQERLADQRERVRLSQIETVGGSSSSTSCPQSSDGGNVLVSASSRLTRIGGGAKDSRAPSVFSPVGVYMTHGSSCYRRTLCRRLAQCLNPQLPTGVHLNTLKIYDSIFNCV